MTKRDTLTSEALQLVRRISSIATVDDQLAELAMNALGDPQLTAIWLALPLEELENRSPTEAWVAGEHGRVAELIQSNCPQMMLKVPAGSQPA